MLKALLLLSLCFFLACSGNSGQNVSVESFRLKLSDSNIPIKDFRVFNAETDPNSLLGRPGRYIEKASWLDSRVDPEKTSSDCTVEAFKDLADLQERMKHLDQVYGAIPITKAYVFTHKNLILRVPFDLTPDQADAYKKVLESL